MESEHAAALLGPLVNHAFLLLVGVAVVVGFEVVVRRAPKLGLDRGRTASLMAWTLLSGFVGSHLFAVIVYAPGTLLRDPLELLRIWGGMSSFGGILGGLAGAFATMSWRRMSAGQMARFVDGLAFAFPFAWIFGRAGCALTHDHPGLPSSHWLAVRFPDGPRLDLGFLELLFILPLAAAFFWLDRRPRPTGFFFGLFFALYGPARFALDALRVGETRYLGWTPGQYLSLALTAAGLIVLTTARRRAIGPRSAAV